MQGWCTAYYTHRRGRLKCTEPHLEWHSLCSYPLLTRLELPCLSDTQTFSALPPTLIHLTIACHDKQSRHTCSLAPFPLLSSFRIKQLLPHRIPFSLTDIPSTLRHVTIGVHAKNPQAGLYMGQLENPVLTSSVLSKITVASSLPTTAKVQITVLGMLEIPLRDLLELLPSALTTLRFVVRGQLTDDDVAMIHSFFASKHNNERVEVTC